MKWIYFLSHISEPDNSNLQTKGADNEMEMDTRCLDLYDPLSPRIGGRPGRYAQRGAMEGCHGDELRQCTRVPKRVWRKSNNPMA